MTFNLHAYSIKKRSTQKNNVRDNLWYSTLHPNHRQVLYVELCFQTVEYQVHKVPQSQTVWKLETSLFEVQIWYETGGSWRQVRSHILSQKQPEYMTV